MRIFSLQEAQSCWLRIFNTYRGECVDKHLQRHCAEYPEMYKWYIGEHSSFECGSRKMLRLQGGAVPTHLASIKCSNGYHRHYTVAHHVCWCNVLCFGCYWSRTYWAVFPMLPAYISLALILPRNPKCCWPHSLLALSTFIFVFRCPLGELIQCMW